MSDWTLSKLLAHLVNSARFDSAEEREDARSFAVSLDAKPKADEKPKAAAKADGAGKAK